jgi:two-component system, NarL family, invasion response regulator UvrY
MSAFLIVDDHAILRSGLARMIKSAFPNSLVGEAQDSAEALGMVTDKTWDVLILDIGLPGRSGLDVLQDVQRIRPKLPVLVLTGLVDDAVAISVFAGGAMGYLCKDCSEADLTAALRKLLDGGRYLTESLAEKLAANLSRKPLRPDAKSEEDVTGRMLDVLMRIGNGDTVKAIASDMGLSVKTVSTYRMRLIERLHLKSNADIVRYCLLRGLSQ